jgi:hypothetical protein
MRIPKLSFAVADGLRALMFRFRGSNPPEVAGHIQDPHVLYQNEIWIPLAAASRIMYDELDGTMWRTMADRETSTDDRLNYMAGCLVQNAPIEGRPPPSSTHRSIPSGAFESGIFKGGGKYFQRYYESYLTYLDMRVKVADLRDALERMKAVES